MPATLKKEHTFTHTRLVANTHTSPLAIHLEPSCRALKTLESEDEALWFETVRMQAYIQNADSVLDRQARSLSRLLLNHVNGDRDHPLMVRYFGKKSPSAFTRTGFAEQLKAMSGWGSLNELDSPPIKELVKEIQAAVERAQKGDQR